MHTESSSIAGKLAMAICLALLGAGLASNATGAEPERAHSPQDVFNTLQQNVWYLPTTDQKARLYVTEIGEGDPVVFLHGGPGNDFNYIIDALRPHLGKHRFVLFDQRGSLLSPVAADEISGVTIDLLVADLEQLRQALGISRLKLLGHSFGSLLALSYYQKHPANVASLILSATFPPFVEGGKAGFIKDMRPRQKALRERPAEIDRALERAGLPKDPAQDTPRQRRMRTRIVDMAPLVIIDLERWPQAIGGGVYYNEKVDTAVGNSLPSVLDFREVLERHPKPIAIIQGDRDYIDPAGSQWLAIAARQQNIRISVIPASSHYAWIDDPRAFERALRDALLR
jgi:pimeloyl-ACP methyl ester carboxylesterase